MSFFALGRLKNHKVPHLHPNSTMFMPLDRLQLKIYAFSGKFNLCSKRVLLSWIKICRDFTLQTQNFTQKYRSWLRFYSEFLRKKLAVEVSDAEALSWLTAAGAVSAIATVGEREGGSRGWKQSPDGWGQQGKEESSSLPLLLPRNTKETELHGGWSIKLLTTDEKLLFL